MKKNKQLFTLRRVYMDLLTEAIKGNICDVCYELNVSFPDNEQHHVTEFVMFELLSYGQQIVNNYSPKWR